MNKKWSPWALPILSGERFGFAVGPGSDFAHFVYQVITMKRTLDPAITIHNPRGLTSWGGEWGTRRGVQSGHVMSGRKGWTNYRLLFILAPTGLGYLLTNKERDNFRQGFHKQCLGHHIVQYKHLKSRNEIRQKLAFKKATFSLSSFLKIVCFLCAC